MAACGRLNRNDMPWGNRGVLPGKGVKRDEALRDYYRKLIDVRRNHTALSRGAFRRLSSDGDLLVFERHDAGGGQCRRRGGEPWPGRSQRVGRCTGRLARRRLRE